MGSRRSLFAILALFSAISTSDAASVKTTNFIVETARQDDAEEFARLAEHFRKQKAIEWLGKEMPAWRQPCRLRVIIRPEGAGGATTFDFNGQTVNQEMQIEGARERLKTSVLPHEVTHTVFAHHFRQPVPRWADEGGSVYSEDDLERRRHDKLCNTILNSGEGIPLTRLFRLKDYPKQVMTLYAEGYSVTKFLVEQSDRQHFLNFVAAGMQNNNNNWDAAVREYYKFKDVADLEFNWIEHLKKVALGEVSAVATKSRPAPQGADGKLVVYDSTPPARPNFDPPPGARGLIPSGNSERASGDIGWNRPRARVSEEPMARIDPRVTGTSGARPHTPSAVLLPPEPAPRR